MTGVDVTMVTHRTLMAELPVPVMGVLFPDIADGGVAYAGQGAMVAGQIPLQYMVTNWM